ncbi:uncharacterized protein MELLADRAFT_102496 [Melampsora larici-populina 98AG31]|uniref:Uncharacterized protein n=1 Tax=Melampsora larici-populina (strain 98AG31 / pathotype 3-4-7) TaxID=747676 RepID=F4R8I2_MELLP|nr:uncharacterized protein MELLADRAFT_102496 [Melampsora larici-populina 98AG31]EGG11485.1 hypothetical protein MELLADRAFT_102496 [Melampsora larici-populina 98AG31]
MPQSPRISSSIRMKKTVVPNTGPKGGAVHLVPEAVEANFPMVLRVTGSAPFNPVINPAMLQVDRLFLGVATEPSRTMLHEIYVKAPPVYQSFFELPASHRQTRQRLYATTAYLLRLDGIKESTNTNSIPMATHLIDFAHINHIDRLHFPSNANLFQCTQHYRI